MQNTSIQPTGVSSLLIALNTPGLNGLIGIPVLLWGRPGVGKSSFIEGLSSERMKVLTIVASIYDPTDFSGLPIQYKGEVIYAPPAWIQEFKEATEGILFLDELSTCPPSVQAALLRVIFERRVGFESLPDHVRIVAAANPPDLMVGGWELSPPMRNRFVHIHWDIGADVFTRALIEGWSSAEMYAIDPSRHRIVLPVWKARMAAFLKVSPDLLHGDPSKDQFGYASPRSWEYATHLMASCDVLGLKPDLDLLKGCLGEGIAVALAEYLENLKQPDPEEVLAQKVHIKIKEMNDGEVFVLFAGFERVFGQNIEKQRFLSYARQFFTITQQVNQAGRQDVIFVSLRRLAKAGLLTRVMVEAQMQSTFEKGAILAQITDLFSNEGLKEFIDVLT